MKKDYFIILHMFFFLYMRKDRIFFANEKRMEQVL